MSTNLIQPRAVLSPSATPINNVSSHSTITLTPTEARFLSLLDEFARVGRKTVFPPSKDKAGYVIERESNKPSVKLEGGTEASEGGREEEEELAAKIREVREVEHVECRIAGGWVRDKLLNLPSSDLDVTLSSISGYPFALAFVTWLHALFPAPPPTSTSTSSPDSIAPNANSTSPTDTQISLSLSSIGKVAANPSQSKHLETATTRIMGLDLDFVALRSESYADGSRIPSEVRLGTPEEDALRRDITINTLFYNVHTHLIEDHTTLGLSDLSNGIIRTPLPPIQTFKDDPLRILRCVRFASRFGFELVDGLREALGHEGILEALRTRISRERVGIEVEKMLKGPNPLLSIQLMTSPTSSNPQPGLYPHIFIIPSSPTLPNLSPCPAPHPTNQARLSAEILTDLLPGGKWNHHLHPGMFSRGREGRKNGGEVGKGKKEKEKEKELWLACCLAPYRGGVVKEKKKDVMMTELVVKDGLKLSNSDSLAVNNLFAAATTLSMPEIDYPAHTIRSTIGTKLRQPHVHNVITETHWTDSLLFSLVMDLLPHRHVTTSSSSDISEETLHVFQKYHAFVSTIERLNLPSVIDDKPLLDGKEINAVLSIKPSQFTGVVLGKVVEWQLDNPGSGKEECKCWLMREREEGRLKVPVQKGGEGAGRAVKKQKKV